MLGLWLRWCFLSHPTGVRGLKFGLDDYVLDVHDVAPHWGTWIEIHALNDSAQLSASRTPLGCVD